jgi:hypothetical protein
MVPGSGMFLAPEGAGGCVCGGGLRISMGLMPRTDAPQFRLAPRCFLDKLEIAIEAPLGGEVYYTTDGSDPTLRSMKYRGPITLTETTVVRARSQGLPPGSPLSYCVERRYEKIRPPRLATAAKINFQPLDGIAAPKDFWIDSGEQVAIHDDGFAYGWTEEHHAMSRQKSSAAPELDTVASLRGSVQWQAAVENGRYEVILGVQAQKDNQAPFQVSGVEFGLGKPTDDSQWNHFSVKREVEVRDGILRLQAANPDRNSRNMNLTHIIFRKR